MLRVAGITEKDILRSQGRGNVKVKTKPENGVHRASQRSGHGASSIVDMQMIANPTDASILLGIT